MSFLLAVISAFLSAFLSADIPACLPVFLPFYLLVLSFHFLSSSPFSLLFFSDLQSDAIENPTPGGSTWHRLCLHLTRRVQWPTKTGLDWREFFGKDWTWLVIELNQAKFCRRSEEVKTSKRRKRKSLWFKFIHFCLISLSNAYNIIISYNRIKHLKKEIKSVFTKSMFGFTSSLSLINRNRIDSQRRF